MVTKEQRTAENTDKTYSRGGITGSMEFLSALQTTADMEGLDGESKTILRSKEVLAVILQETVEEYKGYSVRDIWLKSAGYTILPEACRHSCPLLRKRQTTTGWRSVTAYGSAEMIFRPESSTVCLSIK